MESPRSFSGFPPESVKFYRGLARNNSKVWFEKHRDEYESFVLAPARDFVYAMGRKLEKIAPGVHADPRVDRSIFRIYRDTRFSKDKSPFKTHLGIWLWEGSGKRMECSGFYFHLEPPSILLGVGLYMFPQHLLEPYREAAVDPKRGPALARAVKKATEGTPYELWGGYYKRVPRGYDPQHRNADLLLHNGLCAGFEAPLPEELYAPALVDYCFGHFKALLPLHKWLKEMIDGAA